MAIEKEVKEKEAPITDTLVKEEAPAEGEEKKDFSPENFLSDVEDEAEEDGLPVIPKEGEEKPDEEKPDEGKPDEEAPTFEWDAFGDEEAAEKEKEALEKKEDEPIDKPIDKEEEAPEKEKNTEKEGDDSPPINVDPVVIDKFKELGIQAKSMEEVYAAVEGVIKEKQIYENSSFTNNKITAWKNYLSLEDKELVLKNFELEKVPEDKRNEFVQDLEKSNGLGMEAHKIRAAIRGSIDQEVAGIKQGNEQKEAKRLESVDRTRKELQSHLDGTETMFGFKMAKEEKDLEKVRAGLYKYISNGTFADEVFATPESVVKTAWFFKNADQIISALQGKGSQAAKAEILNDLENPTKDTHISHENSEGDGEFDPKAFSASDKI